MDAVNFITQFVLTNFDWTVAEEMSLLILFLQLAILLPEVITFLTVSMHMIFYFSQKGAK